MKISVVIPALKEKENLLVLTKKWIDFFNFYQGNDWTRIRTTIDNFESRYPIINDWALIYVLDGSKEDSGYNILKKNYKDNKHIRLFYRPDIKGYGPSLKFGFEQVSKDSDYVCTMDTDNHSPEELVRFIRNNEDIIIGSRGSIRTVGPWWKRTASKILNKIMSKMMNLDIEDKTSGYRLYKTSVIKQIYNEPLSQSFTYLPELLICAKNHNFTFKEVPITFSSRKYGISKMDTPKVIKEYLALFWSYL